MPHELDERERKLLVDFFDRGFATGVFAVLDVARVHFKEHARALGLNPEMDMPRMDRLEHLSDRRILVHFKPKWAWEKPIEPMEISALACAYKFSTYERLKRSRRR
jgi:hypothetical protein